MPCFLENVFAKPYKDVEYVSEIYNAIRAKNNWYQDLNTLSSFEVKEKIKSIFNELNISADIYIFELLLLILKKLSYHVINLILYIQQ